MHGTRKGLAIVAVVIASLAYMIPVFGFMVMWLALGLAAVAAFMGERTWVIVTIGLSLINLFVFSPATLGMMTQDNGGFLLMGTIIAFAAPIAAMLFGKKEQSTAALIVLAMLPLTGCVAPMAAAMIGSTAAVSGAFHGGASLVDDVSLENEKVLTNQLKTFKPGTSVVVPRTVGMGDLSSGIASYLEQVGYQVTTPNQLADTMGPGQQYGVFQGLTEQDKLRMINQALKTSGARYAIFTEAGRIDRGMFSLYTVTAPATISIYDAKGTLVFKKTATVRQKFVQTGMMNLNGNAGTAVMQSVLRDLGVPLPATS